MLTYLAGNGNGTFQPPTAISVPDYNNALAAGDFNGDGKVDLILGHAFNSQVMVLLGNGNGTFQTAVNYLTAATSNTGWVNAIVTGDFNGDGKLDFAATNGTGDNLGVLLGNGNGTFQTAVTYNTGNAGTAQQWLATADLNVDGKLDLVAGNGLTGVVSVFIGNGDGTFQAKVDYSASAGVVSVALGDMNGDGKPDIVTANGNSSSISVLLNNGDGTFGSPTQSAFSAGTGRASSVAIADMNGDGKNDVVVTDYYNSRVYIFFGHGDGTFSVSQGYTTGTNPGFVLTGDFNANGSLDMAVATGPWGSGGLSVFVR